MAGIYGGVFVGLEQINVISFFFVFVFCGNYLRYENVRTQIGIRSGLHCCRLMDESQIIANKISPPPKIK